MARVIGSYNSIVLNNDEGEPIQYKLPVLDKSGMVIDFGNLSWVKEYIDNGHDPEALLKTWSCYTELFYSENKTHCGHCSNCLKRYMALELNNLKEDYVHNPLTSPMIDEFYKRFDSYNSIRQSEIEQVFGERKA